MNGGGDFRQKHFTKIFCFSSCIICLFVCFGSFNKSTRGSLYRENFTGFYLGLSVALRLEEK